MSFKRHFPQTGELGWWPIDADRLKRLEEVKMLIGQKQKEKISTDEQGFYKSVFTEWSKDNFVKKDKSEKTNIGDASTMMDSSQMMSDEYLTPKER